MTYLTLNDPGNYKEFYGRNKEQMPKLWAEGRIPLSVTGLMQRRLEVITASEDVKTSWWDNYFDTGDAIAYHPSGKVKVVLDAQPLGDLTPKSRLSNGALILDDGVYETLEGQEFLRAEVGKYATQKLLSRRQVNANPFWRALARDKDLLSAYSAEVFKLAKKRFGYDKNMAFFVGSLRSEPIMRLWCVGRLDLRSLALGNGDLDDDNGCLVGVVSEALQRNKQFY